jgi:hypothetical protein
MMRRRRFMALLGGAPAAWPRAGRANSQPCRWSGFFVVHRLPMDATSVLASRA